MGRWNTGAQTTEASKRIELSYLIKHKFIVKGSKRVSQMGWTMRGESTGNIGIETSYFGNGDDYIRLTYTQTANDIKTDYDYRISLLEKDSNLGKGKVLYLICNHTGELCRILYMAYGSPYFKSRAAYKHRIYYPNQMQCKKWRCNSRFFELENKLEKVDSERATKKYNGNYTKRYLKNQKLEGLYHRMNYLRLQVLTVDLKKMGCDIDFGFGQKRMFPNNLGYLYRKKQKTKF